MKKILLTGASGNVGYNVLQQLVAKNKYDITIFDVDSRKTRNKFKRFKDKVKIIYGSITDKELVYDKVKDFDIVIHLAAIIPPLADKKPELANQVNVEGTRNIVNAIKNNKKGFLLFSSSIAVYGDRINNSNIYIDDKLNPGDDHYAKTKVKCEKLIKDSGIDYSIFRLTAIMGKPKVDPLMFHMPLETKMEICTSVDAARAFVNSVEHLKELNKRIFNIGGGNNCRTTFKSFIRNVFKRKGLNIRYLSAYAFAEKNFHCGYLMDSDESEEILHYRSGTLDDYYELLGEDTSKFVKLMTFLLSPVILFALQEKSEPLQAYRKNDTGLIRRFFKK